jgi:dCTP deaminase
MFLSASEIQDLVASGELLIDPFLPENFKPASYILRLGNRWRKWAVSSEPVDIGKPVDTERLLSPIITSDEYVLSNAEFCLAATIEQLSLPPNLVGIVAPLSHISRWGLSVNLGSMIVSPKFGATTPTCLTLELASHNPSPLKLKAGLPICHLAFIKVTSSDKPRPLDRSIYEGRETPSSPCLSEEWNIIHGVENG